MHCTHARMQNDQQRETINIYFRIIGVFDRYVRALEQKWRILCCDVQNIESLKVKATGICSKARNILVSEKKNVVETKWKNPMNLLFLICDLSLSRLKFQFRNILPFIFPSECVMIISHLLHFGMPDSI